VTAPTEDFSGPASVRLTDVTTTGFKAVVAVSPGTTVSSGTMDVSFLAVAPGLHQLPGANGLWLEAGTISTKKVQQGKKCRDKGMSRSWSKVDFSHSFAEPPAFLSTVQTTNNEIALPTGTSQPWFTVATNSVHNADAWVSLDLSETGQVSVPHVKVDEVIGWVAMQKGSYTFHARGSSVTCAAAVSERAVTHKTTSLSFGADLGAAPLVVASQSTRWGGDGSWAKIVGTTSASVQLKVQEDQTCNDETGHTREVISVAAFSSVCTL